MKTLAEVPNPQEIEHFAWVEPWLARGGQPKPPGYAWLAEHDFDVVVNLRTHDLSNAVRKGSERLKPVHIPVKNDRAPNFEQAIRWLAMCKASQTTGRLFVHCNAGEGRTSTFCALVRIGQGWTLDDAIAEQRSLGFQPEGQHKEQAIFLGEFDSSANSGAIAIPRLDGQSLEAITDHAALIVDFEAQRG